MTRLPRRVICLVTDRRRLAPQARTLAEEFRTLHTQLDDAMAAGVDVIQVRERDLPAGALVVFVSELMARRPPAVQVLVNDRADVAIAAGADGLHLPGQGVATGRVRGWQPRWTIGRSLHAVSELADVGKVDYLIAGTIFPTGSKPADATIGGIDHLTRIVQATDIPVLAIGGMTPTRVDAVLGAGAAGVAAIGLFLSPGQTAEALGAAQGVRELRVAMLRFRGKFAAVDDDLLQ